MYRIGRERIAVDQHAGGHDHGGCRDQFAASLLRLEEAHDAVDTHQHQHQVEDIEAHARNARRLGGRVVTREEGHRRAVLVEGHPEEDHHGEDEHQRRDARLGLGRSQFGRLHTGRGGGGSLLLGRHVGMLERLAEAHVDQVGDNQRDARHAEAHVVGRREFLDIVARELAQVGDRRAHRGGQLLEFGQRFGGHLIAQLEVLVSQGRDLSVVDQAVLGQEVVGDPFGHARGEHRADVDGHIEDREGIVAFGLVGGVVVEVAHQHLEVTLEEARTAGDQRQGAEHHRLTRKARTRRDREQRIARKHHEDSQRDHLSEAEPVGQNAAEEGHEIDRSQEDAVDLGRNRFGVTEFCLQKQREDRKHGVVAEALARIGQRKGVQTFGLSFEHS